MIEIKLLSSLEKVFPTSKVTEKPLRLQALQGETLHFQLALRLTEKRQQGVFPRAEGPVRLRRVVGVPVRMANYPDGDGDTLCGGEPGLYPDLLQEIPAQGVQLTNAWTALWVDVDTAALPAGEHPITVQILDHLGARLAERTIPVEVLSAFTGEPGTIVGDLE